MESNKKTIHAGWIIDGTGRPAHKDRIIEIDGEAVSLIKKPVPEVDLSEGSIDLSNCTILPGLIDSHTHLSMSGSLDPEIRNAQITDEYRHAELRIEKHIRDYLKFGVVAVRDGGDFHAHVLRYKNDFNSVKENGVTIYAAGNGWHKKGRYGQLLGMYLEQGKDLALAIREDFKPGTDHIKIVNSGLNSLKNFGKETAPQFTAEEIKRTILTGNDLGLKAMVHANGYEPVKIALEAGCHSIEHGFFMGDENIRKMAETGIVWVPTICTMKAYMESLSDHTTEYLVAEKTLHHQLEQVRKAIEYGVTIALGTDSGSPGVFHGFSVVEELKLLMEAGLTLEKAVQCGTCNAFKLAGNDGGGAITSGVPATFIAVKGRPENLPDSLYNVIEVWVRGDRFRRVPDSMFQIPD
ncbi:amidohydrolase family protein [Thermodesulfobacteriota bacterium]